MFAQEVLDLPSLVPSLLAVAAQGDQVPAHEVFGPWSLLPPLLAIVLAIATREALLSLFLGVWSGGMARSGGTSDQ